MTQTVEPSYIGRRRNHVDCLFFGEAPGRDEAKEGKAFIGRAGQLLRRVIEHELPNRSCVLDNVVPEVLRGGIGKPDNDKRKEYAEYRQDSIVRHNPRVVVLMGEHAFRAFGLKLKPTANVGRILAVDGVGQAVVLCVHPAYALRNPKAGIPMMAEAFKSVRACLREDRCEGQRLDNPKSWLNKRAKRLCTLDIETSEYDPRWGRIITAAVACEDEAIWFPVFGAAFPENNTLRTLVEWWPKGPRIAHNVPFELAWMRSRQAADPPMVFDTLILQAMVDENLSKGLDDLLLHHFQTEPYWLKIKPPFDEIPLDRLGPYNLKDALWTQRLFWHLMGKLTKSQERLCKELFYPLQQILVSIEQRGVKCSSDELKRIQKAEKAKLTKIRKKIAETFPGLNPRSHPQMIELLYNKLGLKAQINTKKRKPSANDEALSRLVKEEPRLKVIQDFRRTQGFLTRVVEPWREFAAVDGFLHTHLRVGHVVTWRLSSSQPNLLNVARDGAERRALVSRFRNGRIVQADYGQHELRVYAAVADDRVFLDGWQKDADFDHHSETARKIRELGVECDRARGKNINFATTYDITEHGLWEKYGIPKREGRKLVQVFKQIHPALPAYHAAVEHEIAEKGYVENMFGLRRRITDPEDQHQRRQALNYPIQSAAVIICYLAMLDLERELVRRKMKALVILQVHDSIVVDCPRNELSRVRKMMKEVMLNVKYRKYTGKRLKNDIPLRVEIKEGEHY